MPRRAVTKKTTTKRYYKRKTYKKKQQPLLYRMLKTPSTVNRPIAFPRTKTVKMRLCTVNLMTPDGGTPKSYQTKLFDLCTLSNPLIQDPILDQPMGHDEWMGFYTNYTVIGAKVTCDVTWSKNVATSPSWVGIGIINDPTVDSAGDIDVLRERGIFNFKLIVPTVGVTCHRRLVKYYDAKKFFNLKDIKDADYLTSAFTNLTTTVPARRAYLAFIHNSYRNGVNLSNTNDEIIMNMQIDFIVSLSEPKSLGDSDNPP